MARENLSNAEPRLGSCRSLLTGTVLLLAISCTGQQPPRAEGALEGPVARLQDALLRSDFEGGAALFHYPGSYTQDELAADQAAVASGLSVLVDEFGLPMRWRLATAAHLRYDALVGGGALAYWRRLPRLGRDITLIYEADFSREGQGFVVCHLFDNEGRLEFQAAGFGLPASRQGGELRAQEIVRRLEAELAH